MPIKYEQIKQVLTAPKSHYLVSGDEYLLMMEAQDMIRSAMRSWGAVERKVYDVKKNFDFSELTSASENFSLFSETKIIELRFESVPNKAQQKELEALWSEHDDQTLWLLSCPKLDKRQWGQLWIQIIEKHGYAVQIWPVYHNQLPRWIQQRAQAMQLTLTSDAIQCLCERSEGNLLASHQDLQRLALLSSDSRITEQQVLDFTSDNARYSIYELMDTALSGDIKKSEGILKRLKREGVSEVLIISTLYREARQLLKMSQQIKLGLSIEQTMQKAGVWKTKTRVTSLALQRVPEKVWSLIVARCAHLDLIAKGQIKGQVWNELMTCLLLMAGRSLWRKVI